MDRPSIRDVAALAGVATSTVSVVLNDVEGARVRSQTRQRVREAAELLGYTPNPQARSLRGATIRSVFLITDLIATGPYGGDLIQGVQDVCWEQHARLVVLNTGGSPSHEAHAFEFAQSQRPMAMIFAPLSETARQIDPRPRLILANCAPKPRSRNGVDGIPFVVVDEVSGGRIAGQELMDLGHRSLGLISVSRCKPATERAKGFTAVASDAGARVHRVNTNRYDASSAGGRRLTVELLHQHPEITALFCFNDRMAMGAYQAAAELGLRIPEDLSVIGFDNAEPIAESLRPSLTTVAMPYQEVGESAARIALDEAHPAWQPASHAVVVAAPLVRRFSAVSSTQRETSHQQPVAPPQESHTVGELR